MAEIVLNTDVVLVWANDGSARLLDLKGSFYVLDRVAAQMLGCTLDSGRTSCVESLAKLFSVSEERLTADLESLLDQLMRCRVIRSVGELGEEATWFSWEKFLIAPALTLLRSRWISDPARIWSLLLLARTSFSLCGWTRTVAVWNRNVPGSVFRSADVNEITETVRRMSARHWFNVKCKERAMCCWTLLRWLGVSSSLVVGISLFPLRGHSWCVLNDEILADDADYVRMFTIVKNYC
jgi:Transglutaminase-like superfamily